MQRFSKWGTLASCSLSCFLVWLDFAIVNTAIPAIQKDLGASILQMQWVMNAYIIALAVLIVSLGRISDHYGPKKMLLIGVLLFGLFSLTAGLAANPILLILSRFMQGVASAAIIPTSIALISHAFPGEQKGYALGVWGGVGGVGMAIGPVVGGFLVSLLSWRWIFFINVPLSVVAIATMIYYVVDSKKEERALKPDYKGVILLTVGLFSLVFALMHGPDWGWISQKAAFFFILSVISFIAFFILEKRSKSPTIPFVLFKHVDFLRGTLAMIGLVFAFTSVLFLIPLYLINVRGEEAYQAGLMILPITGGIAILSPITGKLMLKHSHNKLILIGLALYLASLFFQIFINPETSYAWLLICYFLLGMGWGIARTPATTMAVAAAPSEFAGTGSGVLWTVQNVFGSISIAIILTLFRTLSGEGKFSPQSFTAGYRASLIVLTCVFIAIIFLFLILRKKTAIR
ncbi:MAG: DHA2 family efflux MFS transporter permease subunit [Parachlamydiales bacterium]|nr:DHA2 family efflux MFS transporter permease subunit [Parachlamydiales bacterium]